MTGRVKVCRGGEGSKRVSSVDVRTVSGVWERVDMAGSEGDVMARGGGVHVVCVCLRGTRRCVYKWRMERCGVDLVRYCGAVALF
jgi:hypothetical protein